MIMGWRRGCFILLSVIIGYSGLYSFTTLAADQNQPGYGSGSYYQDRAYPSQSYPQYGSTPSYSHERLYGAPPSYAQDRTYGSQPSYPQDRT